MSGLLRRWLRRLLRRPAAEAQLAPEAIQRLAEIARAKDAEARRHPSRYSEAEEARQDARSATIDRTRDPE